MLVSELVEEVSRYLQDNEFEDDVAYVHWTRQDLLTYARNALTIVTMVHKEDFIQTVEMPLQAGVFQTIPKPCKTLKTVQGQPDENGVVNKRVREVKLSSLQAFSRSFCSAKTNSTSAYEVKSYSYDKDDPKTLIVDPPVPDDVSGTLIITCYAPPVISDESDDIDIDEKYRPIIFELMLYYGWGVDIEDTASRERSNQHWKHAMDLLQLYDYKQQQDVLRVARGMQR